MSVGKRPYSVLAYVPQSTKRRFGHGEHPRAENTQEYAQSNDGRRDGRIRGFDWSAGSLTSSLTSFLFLFRIRTGHPRRGSLSWGGGTGAASDLKTAPESCRSTLEWRGRRESVRLLGTFPLFRTPLDSIQSDPSPPLPRSYLVKAPPPRWSS